MHFTIAYQGPHCRMDHSGRWPDVRWRQKFSIYCVHLTVLAGRAVSLSSSYGWRLRFAVSINLARRLGACFSVIDRLTLLWAPMGEYTLSMTRMDGTEDWIRARVLLIAGGGPLLSRSWQSRSRQGESEKSAVWRGRGSCSPSVEHCQPPLFKLGIRLHGLCKFVVTVCATWN